MRAVREERAVLKLLPEQRQVEEARPDEHADHTVEQVDRPEGVQEGHGGLPRPQGGGERPQAGGEVERVLVDVDPEQAVAVHRQAEELVILGAGAGHEAAIGQDEADGADRGAEGPARRGPAMGVHAEGRADTEVSVRLHHRWRKADPVEVSDDLRPAPPGPDPIEAGGRVGLDRAALQGQSRPVAGEALVAPRVPRDPDGHRTARGGGLPDPGAHGLGQAVRRSCRQHGVARHRSRIEAARVVQDGPRRGPDRPWQQRYDRQGAAAREDPAPARSSPVHRRHPRSIRADGGRFAPPEDRAPHADPAA